MNTAETHSPEPTAGTATGGDQLARALSRLADTAFDLLAVAECPDLRIVHLNTGGRRLLGLSESEELPAIGWPDIVPSQFLPTLLYEAVPAALGAGEWRGETILRKRNGALCPVQLIITGLPGKGVRLDCIVVAAVDLSSAREIRASLQQEQVLMRALLENLPDSIYFKDIASRFIRASAYQTRKKGLQSPDEIIGKTDFDFFSHEHAQQAFDDEQRIIRSGEPLIDKEEKETWQDGHITWVSSSKMPLTDARGRIIGTFGVSRDITARKVAEEKLQLAQKELLETSRLAGMAEISSGVLHNIGNALNSVNTSVSVISGQFAQSRLTNLSKAALMLQEHTADLAQFLTADPRGRQLPAYLAQLSGILIAERETAQKEVEQLRKNVEHMIEIVAMQQNYARVNSLVEDCDPAELVEESLHISAISLSRHGVAVKRDFAPSPKVHVTRHKVLQILVNFIRNGKYAMDESGRTDKDLQISVSALEGGKMVRIAVRDNGVGIPPENMTRIFGFGFTTRKNGHGFGLHSSANAAKEIGALLSGHSDGPGKGAVFMLDLPVAQPKPAG